MHLAARKGWQEAVEKLEKVDETMKRAQGWNGTTPLMYATIGKSLEIFRFLLEQGANTQLVDEGGKNVLHMSCLFGDLQGVKMLVEGDFGMNINEETSYGVTPLGVAKMQRNNDIVAYLASQG